MAACRVFDLHAMRTPSLGNLNVSILCQLLLRLSLLGQVLAHGTGSCDRDTASIWQSLKPQPGVRDGICTLSRLVMPLLLAPGAPSCSPRAMGDKASLRVSDSHHWHCECHSTLSSEASTRPGKPEGSSFKLLQRARGHAVEHRLLYQLSRVEVALPQCMPQCRSARC